MSYRAKAEYDQLLDAAEDPRAAFNNDNDSNNDDNNNDDNDNNINNSVCMSVCIYIYIYMYIYICIHILPCTSYVGPPRRLSGGGCSLPPDLRRALAGAQPSLGGPR